MKATDLRGKSETELRQTLHELLKEQFNLRMQRGTGQFSRPHLMKDVRRNIARVKTVMNEKRQAGEA
jgi:large subunit ribosomal protein L29